MATATAALTAGMTMFDGITNSEFPPDPEAVGGYVDGSEGDQPNAGWLARAYPGAHQHTIALFPDNDANCLDVEPGAATPESARGWHARQRARGEERPCLYASVSTMEDRFVPMIADGTIPRAHVRLWTAHYGAGEHICGPNSCGALSIDADGTQWTNAAVVGGRVRNLDQSLLRRDFFGAPTPLQFEEIDVKLPVLRQGDADEAGAFFYVRRLQSLTAMTGTLNDIPAAASLKPDGQFGQLTHAGVVAVQGHYRLPQTGQSDAKTWEALLTGTTTSAASTAGQ